MKAPVIKFFFTSIVLIVMGCSEQSIDARGACDAFEELARKGDPYGDQPLAHCFRTGEGRQKDLVKAEQLLLKASNSGRVEAKQDLASLYLLELENPEKYDVAIALLYEVLSTGDPNSLFVLGVAEKNGLGVEKNLRKAKRYFSQAANAGHNVSVFILTMGYCYGSTHFNADVDQCNEWAGRLKNLNYISTEAEFDKYVDHMLTSSMMRKYVFSKRDMIVISQREAPVRRKAK